MARWKLMAPHYLNTVQSAEWEYTEVNGGKQVRKRFSVPQLLDPRDPNAWNNRWGDKDNAEGEVIVCAPDQGEPRDIEFIGDPTPDMMPLDDAAREISAKLSVHWSYKPDSADTSYSQSLIDGMRELSEAVRPPESVKVEGLSELVAVMAQQQKAMTELLSANRRI